MSKMGGLFHFVQKQSVAELDIMQEVLQALFITNKSCNLHIDQCYLLCLYTLYLRNNSKLLLRQDSLVKLKLLLCVIEQQQPAIKA